MHNYWYQTIRHIQKYKLSTKICVLESAGGNCQIRKFVFNQQKFRY